MEDSNLVPTGGAIRCARTLGSDKQNRFNPERVPLKTNPYRVSSSSPATQGSRCARTLGWN